MRPSDYQPHHMGDGKRFHVRTYNGGKWQVYGVGLEHVCECDREYVAEMIAEALEVAANAQDMVCGVHRASEAATLNARIADVHRASEAARLQRLREIGRIDDGRCK